MSISIGIDRLAGLTFIVLGAAFLWLGLDFGFGSMLRIGPGFFPVILSGVLIGFGVAIFVRSFLSDDSFHMPKLGPMTRVLAAIAIFAGFMQPVGSYLILPVVVVLTASASPKFRWTSAVLLAVGTTIFSDLIFRVGLGLPFYAVGYWFGG
ncbi:MULTISPECIES: tripartite tricarboxylate transporter TctB family protein [Neorhizobium]|uniref:tripartite tricarboxylate transporter TctB family protein n=1 Tax=Neorhizobium TaxID=1525371 RepID=UPI000CF98862|nr:tripartite tricarboxylate transporter TctB family protein [Neorhizobium sp. T7_12]